MSFALSPRTAQSLPPLSWCATLHAASGSLMVLHGTSVLLGENFFAEGAWCGTLDAKGLNAASISAASGCVITGDRAIFVTPSNTLARLHLSRSEDRIVISNSLPFLLATCGLALDPNYLFYEDDLSSITHGLGKHTRHIPTRSRKIEIYYHCHVVIDRNLRTCVKQLPSPPAFTTFADYSGYLRDSLKFLLENASASRRVRQYRPIVTISRGYDSPACAVIAADVGCEDAVTFLDPSIPDPRIDCGSEIGHTLGLKVTEFSREAYKDMSEEAEFLSTGTGGEDVFMASLRDILPGRVLVTGFHGDKVWDRFFETFDPPIKRGDVSGADLEEFRLKTDFVHVPLPFFACLRHRDIHRISNSPEMRRWSVPGQYDRPVCRRLAEDRGIERAAFGRIKTVMSRATSSSVQLQWYFGEKSYSDLLAFGRTKLLRRSHPIYKSLHLVARMRNWAVVFLERRISFRLAQPMRRATSFLRRYERALDERSFQLHWALSKIVPRYEAAVSAARHEEESSKQAVHSDP